MIDHTHKFLFVHIPKTAGTSILLALTNEEKVRKGMQDHRSLRSLDPRNGLWSIPFSSNPMSNFREYFRLFIRERDTLSNNRLTQEQFDTYWKFCVVRNPWSRAFSWYQNVVRDPHHQKRLAVSSSIEFKPFVKRFAGKGMLKPQLHWMRDAKDQIAMDQVVKFESIETDFKSLAARLGIRAELKKTLVSKASDYREFYDDETEKLVRSIYQEEIELFGYAFEEPEV